MTEIQWADAVALTALVLLDLLTVAARGGLLNLSLARLLAYRDARERQVNRVVALTHSPRQLRAALILAQNLWRFLIAGLTLGLVNLPLWSGWIFLEVLGILALVAFGMFWLEWLVRSSISKNPEIWALRLSGYVRFLTIFLAPLMALPLAMVPGPDRDPESDSAVTEDDLKTLVDAGQEEGLLEQDERQMIYSIFQLGDSLAREIMVPRIDMNTLEVSTSLTEAVEAVMKAGHSRIPVYEETVDTILGVLYARDLLQVWRDGDQSRTLRDLIRPPYFIPEAKKLDELLAEMQLNRIHMAIVVDEYGGIAGLVTLEDIVEEIVGEIQDEYDQSEESPFLRISDGEYIFQGRVDLGEFNEIMKSDLPQDEAETLGGYVYSQVGRVPAGGESIQVGNLILTVEQVIGRRIRKIRAKWVQPVSAEGKENDKSDG